MNTHPLREELKSQNPIGPADEEPVDQNVFYEECESDDPDCGTAFETVQDVRP